MPSIQVSASSLEAAVAMVMFSPDAAVPNKAIGSPAPATTRFGNIMEAHRPTSITHAADVAMKTTRSEESLPFFMMATAKATITRAKKSMRSKDSSGAISGLSTNSAYAAVAKNRTAPTISMTPRIFLARASTSEPRGAFRESQLAPWNKKKLRPKRPVSSANGVTRPSRGTPM